MDEPPLSIDRQRELLAEAVKLLGGIRASAAAVGYSDRTVGRLLAGKIRIHEHTLEKIASALTEHADQCSALERRLTPACPENRTDAQAKPPKHDGNASRRAPKIDPAELARMARQLGIGKD